MGCTPHNARPGAHGIPNFHNVSPCGPRPVDQDSPAYTNVDAIPDDGFFDTTAAYKGAFSTDDLWIESWGLYAYADIRVGDDASTSFITDAC